jgi:hypothetical protein
MRSALLYFIVLTTGASALLLDSINHNLTLIQHDVEAMRIVMMRNAR